MDRNRVRAINYIAPQPTSAGDFNVRFHGKEPGSGTYVPMGELLLGILDLCKYISGEMRKENVLIVEHVVRSNAKWRKETGRLRRQLARANRCRPIGRRARARRG